MRIIGFKTINTNTWKWDEKMDDNRFYERIDQIDDIGILSEIVCKEYNLGNYLATELIEIGYEDFNAIIDLGTSIKSPRFFRLGDVHQKSNIFLRLLTDVCDHSKSIIFSKKLIIIRSGGLESSIQKMLKF